ncbi:MAG: hypothetical protein A3C80_04035 [Candidatus Ryanbacteria bacterium RIFCSPHIGHO2_02_FULL_45_43]|uniref:LysM domain-containing protein n=1 Tax=Candidatus Ryanbacteria bacterium RIFCSPHIGHO2_01_45_13 TaxID=1802112 RepID=A0A1G2FWT7_9BACT|nr:MAG: hypothetical protein A2718_00065 [Candidatus Ryanbacteria bacterium RIFCSPHIGHO2_01_FULL_44_130]OGZ42546.1 MAG: hypothetical protein A2W41_01595 [Candidatus Ryanbacteria bacterium RIFCSPHIGHO2_01_45_13]OGZ48205.1 MAG: hypothetical protein A3C80_04035 [Candidatus Ryanbacteria bacterium RIFCSPHIGHO2_02_FULL_45_43]OGZ49981.1 MAG: hypothetical protein A3E55_01695 [Candidatus Ryanbacteria bacterium RIFCSPHIGHO2_12_FULL_44_20]OGZ51440.1 MAG: hypothetical protein A3A17_01645 [Candidatus Ryanba
MVEGKVTKEEILPIGTNRKLNNGADRPMLGRTKVGATGLFVLFLMLPSLASAFSFGDFVKNIFSRSDALVKTASYAAAFSDIGQGPFLDPANNEKLATGVGGALLQYAGGNALLPVVGPLGNVADADGIRSSNITTYTVREGDNLSVIADTFDVSIGTIFWANNLKRADLIRPGDVLVILPVTGVKHTVKEGETIGSIANKYEADESEILIFNELVSAEDIKAGQDIIIPNVDLRIPQASGAHYVVESEGSLIDGYFMRPISGGRKTYGLHGFNAVDLATSCGAPLYASASGNVITARSSGWNGGYGRYVAIAHPNGTQTVYSHMQSVYAAPGWFVLKGQQIGTVGTSGRSTGCHVHFEVRGARNPF